MDVHARHVLFVSYYFPPMGGGGVQRVLKFLKLLPRGYDLSVLTVRPSYFYMDDPTLSEDVPAAVRVFRSGSLDPFRLQYLLNRWRPGGRKNAATSPRHESGARLRKWAARIFIPDSRVLWMPFALHKLRQIHRERPIDLLIATLPPFTAGWIGTLAQQWLGIPVVLDFRDAWCNNPYLPPTGAWQSRLQQKLERYCVERAGGFIFVNPVLQEAYLQRFPHIGNRPHATIRNGYDPEDFPSDPVSPGGGLLRIGVMGTVYSQGNHPRPLLIALENLRRSHPNLAKKIRITFLGKWTAQFPAEIRALGLEDQVELQPYRPHRAALGYAARHFDALALALDSRLPGSAAVTPGRIYEYLYLRKPILALCPPDGDLAALVRYCRAGEVIDYSRVAEVQRVLAEWLAAGDSFSKKYRFSHVEEFSRKEQTRKLQEFIDPFLSK